MRISKTRAAGLLSTLAIAAIALSACSSSGSSAAPGATTAPGATISGGVTTAPADTQAADAGSGSGLGDASGAFASIKSYKFSMTLAGGSFGSMLSALGGAGATGAGGITISGTVTSNPAASDIDMAGMRIIEIDGSDYMDLGTGGFIKTPQTGSSLADGFAPSKMFQSSLGTASDYKKVGSEDKNGVKTDHYQASASAFAGMSSALGVTNATWTADVWIAQTGGYPVSMDIVASTSDNSIAYEVKFDITNINDPSLKVTAPTNVTGG